MTQEHSSKEQTPKIKAGPRAIALVGPHGGGKTTLLESIAMITGAVQRNRMAAGGSRRRGRVVVVDEHGREHGCPNRKADTDE